MHFTTDYLIAYAERRNPETREAIEDHLHYCRPCAGEAALWADLLRSLTAPDLLSAPKDALRKCFAIYQRPKRESVLREIFARLVFDSAVQPAVAGIRGESDSQHIVMETDDVEVYLRIAAGSRTVLGQLLRTNGEFLAGARTELLGNGQLVDMTVTDSLGEFRFKTAPEGDLRLQAEIASDCRLIADLDFSKERKK